MAGILQNAFGNTAYVNQTNLNGKLKKLGVGASKNLGGHGPPNPPFRIATAPLQESCALLFLSGCTSARVVRINWQLC